MLRTLGRHGDIVLAVGVVAAVAILVVPLPTAVVDVLLTLNIGGSVVLLLTATYVRQPLRFSALPAILLLTTLFRLALNVSTTRLILSQADAGEVVASFGSFVVAGNYVVGAVIFVILTVIQYVVIAKGSERVAEVSARFTLDALPGRQLAIDADLRAGAIDLEEAGRRRRELQTESRLYGALDGAMKFVKGDAIAGIVITLVNIAAGLAVGVLQQGLALDEAARLYTLLTVGDGLVAQIPAILLATAAGVVVTQVASEGDERPGHLASDIGAQIAAHPRALAVTAGLLLLFAVLPGLPLLPFGALALFLGLIAWGLGRSREPGEADKPGHVSAERRAAGGPRLRLELGSEVEAELRERAQLGALDEALAALGERVSARFGVDVAVGRSLAPSGSVDPPRAGGIRLDLGGVPLRRGGLADGEVVTAESVAGAVGEMVLGHLGELLTLQTVAGRLDVLASEQPALVDASVPRAIALAQLTELLRRLLAERVPVRSLGSILEIIALEGGDGVGVDELVERVRLGLGRVLVHTWGDADGAIRGWVVDRRIEEMIRSSIRPGPRGPRAVLEPDIVELIEQAVERAVDGTGRRAAPLVLLTPSDVRPHLRRLLVDRFPDLTVLGFEEVGDAVRVESRGVIAVGGSVG